MANSQKNLLLVEGLTDKAFFTTLCKLLNLRLAVSSPPQELPADLRVEVSSDSGGKGNNKQGLLNHLPTLLKQFEDRSLERLAFVVDADRQEHGDGFQKTHDTIEALLNKHGFTERKRPPQKHGLLYQHNDGFKDLGVWIMPDNRVDGTFEDFLLQCVCASDKPLLEQAQKAVGSLKAPKFRSSDRAKADLATWLAWQKLPGWGLEQALKDGLFLIDGQPFNRLTAWLSDVFP